jgi:hypothetical protein
MRILVVGDEGRMAELLRLMLKARDTASGIVQGLDTGADDDLTKITSVARSIGAQNLSQRVAVPRTGDELQRMAQAWNDVLSGWISR